MTRFVPINPPSLLSGRNWSMIKRMMEAQYIHPLNEAEMEDIKSVVSQYLRGRGAPIPNEVGTITVWESEMANKYLHSGARFGQYTVFYKPASDYTNPHLVDEIYDIWEEGFFPIELIVEDGGFFFGVPKKAIFENRVKEYELLPYD